MNKPFFFKCLPYRLQKSLFFRFFYPVKSKWHCLFEAASLRNAPEIKMKLLSSDFMHGLIAFTGIYEPELSTHLIQKARAGGMMVDVGANFGYFSLLWAAANPTNKSIAFEASPRNAGYLQKNVDSNGLSGSIKVYPFALGRSDGELEFDPGSDEVTGWGGLSLTVSTSSFQVPVKRLDDVLDSNITVDFLKVDTEGADTWVLMGAENLLLEKRVKEIHFEQNKPRLRQLDIADDDAVNFLDSVGYKAVPLSDPSKDVVEWRAIPLYP